MILRLVSGSVTPASASRNRSALDTVCSLAPVAATKSRSTCSRSPARSSPWSTNTQVNRSPMARWTSAAATAESTPPDRPQIARPSPTWARIAATVSSMIDEVVQPGVMPATSCRNRRSTSWPCGECPTSGWYWTPASRRSMSSNAATVDPLRLDAVTVKPSGAAHDRVAVAHPDRVPGRQAVVQRAGVVGDASARCARTRGCRPCATSPPSALRHGLEPVAEPEDRDAGLEQAGSTAGAPSAYTLDGPPDRITAAGLRATISATGVLAGTISEYTCASRTRRAMSWAYWAP